MRLGPESPDAEKTLPSLTRDRDAVTLQRLFIAPQFTARGRQKGNVARSARTLLAGLAIEQRRLADQTRADLGDDFGLRIALLFRARTALRVGDLDVQRGYAEPVRRSNVKRIQGVKPG